MSLILYCWFQIPENERIQDKSYSQKMKELRHHMALMYRSSQANEDKTSILMFNNPMPDFSDAEGTEGPKRYWPSWIDQVLVLICVTQQNSFSISHLLGTVTTHWLDSDGVVTVVNCQQHGGYTVDNLCSHRATSSCQQWLHHHFPVTVPSGWLME